MLRSKKRFVVLLVLAVCFSAVLMSGSYYEQSDYYPSIDLYCGNNYDGTYIWSANYDEQIDYVSFIEGSLPSGMYTYNDSSSIILNGTPTQEGTFYARYCVETSARRAIVNLQVYVKHNPGYDPAPKPTPAPVGTAPRLTKSPAGETVNVGGSALFIARADNYTGIAWFLVRADYGSVIPVEKIGDYFEGAWANNYYSEKLSIGGIPKSMNGWMVMCYFNNSYGETWSGAAPIYVNSPAPTPAPTPQPTPTPTPAPEPAKQPVISSQPAPVTASIGEYRTISVTANSSDSGTLSYQWYESSTNSKDTMLPLIAAESSTLTVPQVEGTRYYCVEITNSKNGTQYKLVSDIVAVSYKAEEKTETAEVKESPAPVQTPAPAPTPVSQSINLTQYMLYAVIGVLGIAVVVMAIALSRRRGHHQR